LPSVAAILCGDSRWLAWHTAWVVVRRTGNYCSLYCASNARRALYFNVVVLGCWHGRCLLAVHIAEMLCHACAMRLGSGAGLCYDVRCVDVTHSRLPAAPRGEQTFTAACS
jgi:hypothetical protein